MPTAERRWAWPALGLILGGGLALRLWGIRQGLPFVYNIDEADHFVPRAVKMFEDGSLDPHYFANPPAFTYLLHYLFGAWYGGAHGAEHALRTDPESVYTLARVAAAVLGTVSLWLLYLLGSRLFSRAVGLLAAAVEAVAFLPVFYAHLAVNDVPTLAPLTLSLLGSAGVLRKGRLRDHLLAGLGLGLACATKYTAGIVLVPYAAACVASYMGPPRRCPGKAGGEEAPAVLEPADGAGSAEGRQTAGRRELTRALAGVAIMLLAAAAAFVIANPYALLDFSSFHRELVHQSSQSAEAQGKLGAPKQGGLLYYLWSLTWGLGWVPALAALGGAVAVWWRQRALAWMLVPAPLLFLVFMGLQGRYFGRWLMPILPILCLLAAFAGAAAVGLLLRGRHREPRDLRFWVGLRDRTILGAPPLSAALLVVAALLAQGLVYSVHSGLVLARTDTRTLTRTWMLANVPRAAQVVVEPVAPDSWASEAPGQPGPQRCGGHQWCKYPSLLSRIDAAGRIERSAERIVGIESYVRTLAPALLGYYVKHGYCWVVSGSTQADRALVHPAAVPLADAYYSALARQGRVVYRASPYAHSSGPVAFNFDWSFDYYPLAYVRPGPAMTVYRLGGGRCG